MYPNLVRGKLNYTAIAFSALKRIPPALVELLKRNDQFEDVKRWCGVAAVEGYVLHYDFKQTYNLAQRLIYKALKAEGYRRDRKNGMQYRRREIRSSYIQDDYKTLKEMEEI